MTAASNSEARKRQQERRADAEPVERLREAARVLRDETWPDYIDPGLGAAVANWLYQESARYFIAMDGEHPEHLAMVFRPALAVADQILGEA